MSLLTSSIDLETITPPKSVNISEFPESQIKNLANLFLRAGDTISPILLRKTSPVNFEVLEGHFEYFAAIKAQQIDEQFTAIRAYVVPPDLESTMLEQYHFLRSRSTSNSASNPPIESPKQVTNIYPQDLEKKDLEKIEEAIALRLEKKLTAAIEKTIEEKLSSSLKLVINQITEKLDAHLANYMQSLSLVPISTVLEPTAKVDKSDLVLDLKSNNSSKSDPPVKTITKSKTTTKTSTTKTSKGTNKNKAVDNNDPNLLQQVLHDLNTFSVSDLEKYLAKSGKGNVKFAQLIHKQRVIQLFTSAEDVVARVDRLGKATIDKIIAFWLL